MYLRFVRTRVELGEYCYATNDENISEIIVYGHITLKIPGSRILGVVNIFGKNIIILCRNYYIYLIFCYSPNYSFT